MKNLFKTLLILSVLLISSACCSKKEKISTQKAETEKVITKSEKEMLNQGYIQASVVFDKEKATPCSYLIKLNESMYLEPLRELKSDFKYDNQLIWVKYHPQRRMSNCGNAQPVEIIGIEKR